MKGSPKFLVYDIETVPLTELVQEWKDSGEYDKDREKQKTEEGEEPFPPIPCHKVATIATMTLDTNLQVIESGVIAGGCVEGDEKAQVEEWNRLANNKGKPLTIVDWNGKRFDVPVLQYRAFRYGIQMPWYFGKLPDQKGQISSWSKRYRDRFGGRHVDLVEEWTNHGAFTKCQLKELAMLMGLPGKTGIDGSQVFKAWKDGRHKEIDDYCVEDVWHTALVLARYSLLSGGLSRDRYIEVADNMLSHFEHVGGHDAFMALIDRDHLLLKA